MTLCRFSLDDRVAVVTGAGRGIGQAIAVGLAEMGANVALASRSGEELEETSAKIRELGRRSLPVATDVGKEEDVDRLVASVVDNFGQIDILVNAAGVSSVRIPAEELPLDEWDRIVNINLRGAWMCCQAVGRVMIPRRRGKIVNVTSVNSTRPSPGILHYNVSKAGLMMITRDLALEWAKYNIQVNSVGPGAIVTRMTEKRLTQPDIKQATLNRIPAGRLGEPEDIVGAVLFLASDASNYVTGTEIFTDGGWLLP